ncbi:MAG TPA: serine hydrolase domain-containing protein [Gemmatimonadaceae bacterium]|nr:serine hydrolase domain-containing protein [Gemmatimonadaceae bacterium]
MTGTSILVALCAGTFLGNVDAASAQGHSGLAGLAKRIDSLARPEAAAELLSGVILVAKGDSILIQRSYGYANWELRAPNTPGSRFNIGSITKPMTHGVIEMLAQEGRIDTLAPVAKYLPGFPSGPKGGQPTVAQLLAHRAGVPFRVTTRLEESTHLTPADIVERVRKRGLLFEPGTRELYSSAGYTCLARVVEVVTGQPFDSALVAHVFRPAGMRSATGETGQQLMAGRARGYRLSPGSTKVTVANAPFVDLAFLTGAGDVYATATDMFRFVRAAHANKLGTAAHEELTDTSWTGIYGQTNGYEASVDYYAPLDITFVFLSNLYSLTNYQLRLAVRNLIAGRPTVAMIRPPAVSPATQDPAPFLGDYGDADDPVSVSQENGRLFRDGNEFYPIADGWFYVPGTGARFRFTRGADSTVNGMFTRWESGQERQWARVGPPK